MLAFLGLELDTVQQTSRLPEGKLVALCSQIQAFRGCKTATLREMQQLIGHLNFACKVIAPGRAFLCILCDVIRGLCSPHHRTRISAGIRDDLAVWDQFLQAFNGVSFWHENMRLEAELQITSDASGSVGFGVYFRGHWCAEVWPPNWVDTDIERPHLFRILSVACNSQDLGRRPEEPHCAFLER